MNKLTDIELFELLQKSIANRFLEENAAQSKDMAHWKGQEITLFQEDLFNKTKSTVSEKWFYTYFKSDFKKLPRIDMLNLLSQYCGYRNWADFIQKKEIAHFGEASIPADEDIVAENKTNNVVLETEEKTVSKPITEQEKTIDSASTQSVSTEKTKYTTDSKQRLKWISIGMTILMLLAGAGFGVYQLFFAKKTYEFCFIDSDRSTLVKNSVEVTILREGFTPLYLTSKTGCIAFESIKDTIRMFVSSPYHKQDTFFVNLHQYTQPEKILLEPDDYKVMLYYYSNSAKDLKQRISKLNQMIADDALIYQVYDNDFFGVEILTKQQYINLVSLPTTSLKNYSLIESERKNGKIVKLKFKIQQDENDN